MAITRLHDFQVTQAAALALCKRETVRAYLNHPERMRPATRARVERALRELGYLDCAADVQRVAPEREPR